MRIHQVPVAALLGFASFVNSAPIADLTRDDAALIRHIKTTDHIFAKVLGSCGSERLTCGKSGNFTYHGNCQIRSRPEDDCQRYLVTARGTVDTKSWATIREMRLTLQCTA